MQGVLEIIPGSSNTTSYDPAKTETDNSVPSGCTIGGFDLGKNNGGIRWNLANGVLQLKVNLHFTGDRTFKINWKLANGQTGTFNTAKMKKTTLLAYDLIEVAGISEEVAKQIRSIELLNTATNGGARVYDMYVRVPVSTTGINGVTIQDANSSKAVKFIKDGKVVIMKNGVLYNVFGQKL